MPTNKEWKDWEKAMKAWFKELLIWQRNNPDKDWLQGMGEASLDGPGTLPPPPPPPPPGTNP